jgi:hypothetical protein
VRFVRSRDITFTGCAIHDETEEGQPDLNALLELTDCQRINISGSQFLNGVSAGIMGNNSSHVTITGCTVHDTREKPKARHAIQFTGKGAGNLIANCTLGNSSGKPIVGNAQAEGNIGSGK